jgi:hypothetical protein
MDDEKPDTRHLVLKPKEIVPMDSVARPGDGTAISVQLMHRQNMLAAEKASGRRPDKVADLARPAQPQPELPPVFKVPEIVPLDPPSKPGDEEAIKVHDILMQNRVAEEKAGWGRIKRWTGRKSKRNRDFILLVGGLDITIAMVMKVLNNPVTMIYGIAAIVLATSTISWVMFVVNDDY